MLPSPTTPTLTRTRTRARIEQMLLAAAQNHAVVDDFATRRVLAITKAKYYMPDQSPSPAVHWRITDNWLELSVRLLVHAHARGVQEVKNAMSRQSALNGAGIGIAPCTSDIIDFPQVRPTRPKSVADAEFDPC